MQIYIVQWQFPSMEASMKASNILNGGKGNNLLVSGLGNDKLIGGKGKDIFKLSTVNGYDLIKDFKNKQDKIYIGSSKKDKIKNQRKRCLHI